MRNDCEVAELEPVAGEEQLDVQRERRVSAGQHEAVAAQPVRDRRGRGAGSAGTAGRPPAPGSWPCPGDRCPPSAPSPRPARGRCRPRGGRARPTRPGRREPRGRRGRRGCQQHSSRGVSLPAPGAAPDMPGRVTAVLRPIHRTPRPIVPRRVRVTAVDPRPSVAGAGTGTDPAAAAVSDRLVVRPRSTAAAYVALTKPRIIELLLVTTVPTMILASQGLPVAWASWPRPSSAASSPPAAPTPSTCTSTATSTSSWCARGTGRSSPAR